MKILVLNTVGLQLGYLGCYGNDWIATPNLDRLAAEGITFDQHILQTPDPSATVGFDEWPDRVRAAMTTLTTQHVAIVRGPSLAPPWSIPEELLTSYTEDDEIEAWPDASTGEIIDDESVLRSQDTYAAVVTWFDAQLGRLLNDGIAKDTMLILTSTAGLPLGEHSRLGWDRPWLHEELVHVPLIVRCPGGEFGGLRISALTQPSDLDAAIEFWERTGAVVGEAGIPGLIGGAVESIRPHAISNWTVDGETERAIRTLEWALIRPEDSSDDPDVRSRQLFVKPDDRWEANDIADHEIETADELEAILKAASDNPPPAK